MNKKDKNNFLYIDATVSDHFFISEMLKDRNPVLFAKTEAIAIEEYKNNISTIGLIIIAVDQLDHSKIINGICKLNYDVIPKILLINQNMDSLYMYNLLIIYGAYDYLVKPFSSKL